jgi:hypothetical protein
MNANGIRRYLQPSPTLRWHPWAPLMAGVLLLVFVFWLGAMWGFAAYPRVGDYLVYRDAFNQWLQIRNETAKPATVAYWQARAFDDAIVQSVRESSIPDTAWSDVRRWIEGRVFWNGRSLPKMKKESVRTYAEFRLKHLSGSAPRWQNTATYCEEFRPPLTGENVLDRYRKVAEAYSVVLNRTVTAQELAPNVPGYRCEWRGP